jgi:8-oxo-dGTP pyrophosphatase MutT (NUDIX family)
LECFEEAGLTGVAAEEPLGTYAYVKNGQSHLVTVYVLHVSEILTDWPEARRRHRTFLAPDLASAKVDNEGLRLLIARASSHAVKDWPSEVRRLARLRVVGPRP